MLPNTEPQPHEVESLARISRHDSMDFSNYINFLVDITLSFREKENPNQMNMLPKALFADLWYIFRPQELVAVHKTSGLDSPRSGDTSRLGMLLSSNMIGDENEVGNKSWSQASATRCKGLRLSVLFVDYNGTAFRPFVEDIDIHGYEGEKDILSLPAWPFRLASQAVKVKTAYEECGNMFATFLGTLEAVSRPIVAGRSTAETFRRRII